MFKKILKSLLGQKSHGYRKYSSSNHFQNRRYSSSDRRNNYHGQYGHKHYKGRKKSSSFFSS